MRDEVLNDKILRGQNAKIKEYMNHFLNDPYLQGLNTYKNLYFIT